MKKIAPISLTLISLFFLGCTDNENAEKFLKKDGYINITLTGYNFFECDSGMDSTGFIAQKNGKVVEGTICTGMLLRNSTIKLK